MWFDGVRVRWNLWALAPLSIYRLLCSSADKEAKSPGSNAGVESENAVNFIVNHFVRPHGAILCPMAAAHRSVVGAVRGFSNTLTEPKS